MSTTTALASRPVHPCVTSLTDGTRGAEFCAWARLLPETTCCTPASASASATAAAPNLVTASASSIAIYSVESSNSNSHNNHKLRLEHSFGHLAGSIVALHALKRSHSHIDTPCIDITTSTSTCTSTAVPGDALLVGFAGRHAQLAVVTLQQHTNVGDDGDDDVTDSDTCPIVASDALLQAECLIDFTNLQQQAAKGAVATHDLQVAVCGETHTAACILGGGVAVAVLSLQQHESTWCADGEPFLLPLPQLKLPHQQQHHHQHASSDWNSANPSSSSFFATGWGDVLDAAFLPGGYLEPVLVLLHTVPGGATFEGRLGRGAPPHRCTALTVSTRHRRAAVLWSAAVPGDAFRLSANGNGNGSSDGNSNSNYNSSSSALLLVVGANTLTFLDTSRGGRVQQCLAVNGWAHTTAVAGIDVVPNRPVPLAVQLDGARVAWLTDTVAAVALRHGALYLLHPVPLDSRNHNENQQQWALWPTGQCVAGCGEMASLTAVPLNAKTQAAWLENSNSKDEGDEDDDDKKDGADRSTAATGLLFAGSRLGDSLLLGFAVGAQSLEDDDQAKRLAPLLLGDHSDEAERSVDDTMSAWHNQSIPNRAEDEDDDDMLLLEDEALYAPSPSSQNGNLSTRPDVVPLSSSDEEGGGGGTISGTKATNTQSSSSSPNKRARPAVSVVRTLTPLDVLVNLGPLGPSCEGPIAAVPSYLLEQSIDNNPAAATATLTTTDLEGNAIFGSTAHVVPSGFGSSGGLALVTVPGRDDRMIVTEADCLNAHAVFGLPTAGVVLLGMADGIRVLRLQQQQEKQDKSSEGESETKTSDSPELVQVDVSNGWCTGSIPEGPFLDAQEVFESTLLTAGEYGTDGRMALVARSRATLEVALVLAAPVGEDKERIEITAQYALHTEDYGGVLQSVSPVVSEKKDTLIAFSFGCVWSVGSASLVSVFSDGTVATRWIDKTTTETSMDIDDDRDQETKELEQFYRDSSVIAVDVFKAPSAVFQDTSLTANIASSAVDSMDIDRPVEEIAEPPAVKAPVPAPEPSSNVEPTEWSKLTVAKLKVELKKRGLSAAGRKAELVAILEESDRENAAATNNREKLVAPTRQCCETKVEPVATADPLGDSSAFDEEDRELYAADVRQARRTDELFKHVGTSKRSRLQAGEASLFAAVCRKSGDLEVYSISSSGGDLELCWKTNEAAMGASVLKACDKNDDSSKKRHFPRSHKSSVKEIRLFSCGPTSTLTNFCLAIETTTGDLYLYRLDIHMGPCPCFRRMPLRSITRSSQEQSRHHGKLVRKGIVGKFEATEDVQFVYNALLRFEGISGQDGLFAMCSRPQWIVCERGRPTALAHRARHAAPAGGKPKPVTGFSMGLGGDGDFLTLHERVGRVGSQRLTLFKGLSNVFDSHGLLPGSGYCVEKIPFGVTVRRIVYIEDENVSTGDHPLYALLVSREIEVDQSGVNSDGLSPEERRLIDEEKEKAKIARQVEADLGGFEVESEWVEEIEREDCFKVDMELGGAPPLHQSIYSLWIVDAADRWMVVDSFELGEHEHGLDLQTMYLSEFKDDPGNSSSATTAEDDGTKRFFVVLGTGTVNHNGEDVATKGRALLFEVKRPSPSIQTISSPVAELTLAFEKNVFHGPVSSISCLVAEDHNRLVIGAGSDVNIEQWGSNGKLTQVGFFRATMHISDIIHFKNFLLLSDAYDSLYFLVWRESDKSLTLLAKDYDPIPVYAAGIMSRGAALTFLCHDDRENLQFFQYAPGEAAARGGNKLVCRADFHLGRQTTAFRSHFCRPSLLVHSATPASTLAALKQQDSLFGRQDDDQRLGAHFGTSDGGLGSVVPLSEPVYWRLMALQSVMANALESDCALSQRAWRLYRRTPRRGGCRSNDRKKGVIDGDIVMKYGELPITQQEDIASAIGSSVGLILDNLLEIQYGSMII